MKTILKRFRSANSYAKIDPESEFQLKFRANPLSVSTADVLARNMHRNAQMEEPIIKEPTPAPKAMGQRVKGASVESVAGFEGQAIYGFPNGTRKTESGEIVHGTTLLGKSNGESIVLTPEGQQSVDVIGYDYQSNPPFNINPSLIYGLSSEPNTPKSLSIIGRDHIQEVAKSIQPVFYYSLEGGPRQRAEFINVEDPVSKKFAKELTDVKSFVVRDRSGNTIPKMGKPRKDGSLPIALYTAYERPDGSLYNEPDEDRVQKFYVPSGSVSATQVLHSFGGLHTVQSYFENQVAEKLKALVSEGSMTEEQASKFNSDAEVQRRVDKYMRGRPGDPAKLPIRFNGKSVPQTTIDPETDEEVYVNPLMRMIDTLTREHMTSSTTPTAYQASQGIDNAMGGSEAERTMWRPRDAKGEALKAEMLRWFEKAAAEKIAPGVVGATVTPIRGDSRQDPFAILRGDMSNYFEKAGEVAPKIKDFDLKKLHPKPLLEDFLEEYEDPIEAQEAYNQAAIKWKKDTELEKRHLKNRNSPLPREVDRLAIARDSINSSLQGIYDRYVPEDGTQPKDMLQPPHATRLESPEVVESRRQSLSQVLPPKIMNQLELGKAINLKQLDDDTKSQVLALQGSMPVTGEDYEKLAIKNLLKQQPNGSSTVADDIVRIVQANPRLRRVLNEHFTRYNNGIVDHDMINDAIQAGLLGAAHGYGRSRSEALTHVETDANGQPVPETDRTGLPKLDADGNPIYRQVPLSDKEGDPMRTPGGEYEFDGSSLIDVLMRNGPAFGANSTPLGAVMSRALKYGKRLISNRNSTPKESELDAPIADGFSLSDVVDSPQDEAAYDKINNAPEFRNHYLYETLKTKEYQLDELNEKISNIKLDNMMPEEERQARLEGLEIRSKALSGEIRKLNNSIRDGSHWSDGSDLPEWASAALTQPQTLPQLDSQAEGKTYQHPIGAKIDAGYVSEIPHRMEYCKKLASLMKGQANWLKGQVEKHQLKQDESGEDQTVKRLKILSEQLNSILVNSVNGLPLISGANIGEEETFNVSLMGNLTLAAKQFKQAVSQIKELEDIDPGPPVRGETTPKSQAQADLARAAERFNLADQQIQKLARSSAPLMRDINEEMTQAKSRQLKFQADQQAWIKRTLQNGSQSSNLPLLADHMAHQLEKVKQEREEAIASGTYEERKDEIDQRIRDARSRFRGSAGMPSYNVNLMREIGGDALYDPIKRAFEQSNVTPTPENVAAFLDILGLNRKSTTDKIHAITPIQKKALITSIVAGNDEALQQAIRHDPGQEDAYKQRLRENSGEEVGLRSKNYREKQSLGKYESKLAESFEASGGLGQALSTYNQVANHALPMDLPIKVDYDGLLDVSKFLEDGANVSSPEVMDPSMIQKIAQYIVISGAQFATRMKYDNELINREFVGQDIASVQKTRHERSKLFAAYVDTFFKREQYANLRPYEGEIRSAVATLTGKDRQSDTIERQTIDKLVSKGIILDPNNLTEEDKAKVVAAIPQRQGQLNSSLLNSILSGWDMTELTLQSTNVISRLFPGKTVDQLTSDELRQVASTVDESRENAPMKVRKLIFNEQTQQLEAVREDDKRVHKAPADLSTSHFDDFAKARLEEINSSDMSPDEKLAAISALKSSLDQQRKTGQTSIIESMLVRMRHVVLEEKRKSNPQLAAPDASPYDEIAKMTPTHGGHGHNPWAPSVIMNPREMGELAPEGLHYPGDVMSHKGKRARRKPQELPVATPVSPVTPALPAAPVHTAPAPQTANPAYPEAPDDDDNIFASSFRLLGRLYRTASRFESQGEFDLADKVDSIVEKMIIRRFRMLKK